MAISNQEMLADRRQSLNQVDVANFMTIMDLLCANIAHKALQNASFPLKITIARSVVLPKEQIVPLFQVCVGRLSSIVTLDITNSKLANSKLDDDISLITFWISPVPHSVNFTVQEQLFLKCAAFWLERCYDIAVYQGYISKTDNVFIAGGALNRFYHRILNAERPWIGSIGDVDFWFMDKLAADTFQVKWGTGSKESNENDIESIYKGVYTSRIGMDPLYDMKFQFIHFDSFDPENLHEVFDFEHCLPFWASDDKTLYVKPEHFQYIKDKLLVPTKSVSIIEPRLRKYQEQAFHKIKLPPMFSPPGKWEDKTATIEWYIENILEKKVTA